MLEYIKHLPTLLYIRQKGATIPAEVQASALPHVSTLHSVNVLCLDYLALAEVFKHQPVSITALETTDVRDHSILNVIASIHCKPHLIGVVTMEGCNHSTLSQAIIRSVRGIGIANHHCDI